MIPNSRKPFPFSRLLSIEKNDVHARKELEEVVKYFRDELDVLRDSVNASVDTNSSSNQASIDAILVAIQNLSTQLQTVADSIPVIDLSTLQPFDIILTNLSNLSNAVGELHNDGIGNLSWVRHVVYEALARVAFSGRYKDLTGKPETVEPLQLAKVAYTGSYRNLTKKPLLVGDTLYLYNNTR